MEKDYVNKLLVEIKKFQEYIEFLKELENYKQNILYKSALENTIEKIGEILYKITKRYLLFTKGSYSKKEVIEILKKYLKDPEIIIEGRNFVAHEIYYLNDEETIRKLQIIKDVILKNENNIKKFLKEVLKAIN